MRKLAFAALLAGSQLPADAALVQVQMVNNTDYGIDFSLQMANYLHGNAVNRMFLGQEQTRQIDYIPILLGQGSVTPFGQYSSAGPDGGLDAISLNLRMRYTWNGGYNWDYKEFGMLSKLFGVPHECDMHAAGPISDGQTVLLDLREAGFWPYLLSEVLPNGDSCTFYLSANYGPVLWGETNAAPGAVAPGLQDVPGIGRAMTGAELARADPALHAQLDEDYLRATGIDLRAVRARSQAAASRPASQPASQPASH